MWKVADVKSELEATELLLKTRPDIEKIKSGLVTQLKHKLLNMTEIQAAELVELYNLFQSSSLPADVRNEMLDVLDNRAAAGHNCETSAGKLCLVPQTLTALQHYLTADDISLCEKGSMWAGTEVLASRLRKLGVVSMKECTKKVSIAILVHFEVERTNTIPPGDSVYALAEHMLQALKVSSTTVPADAKSLRRYPASPSQLDAKHFAALWSRGSYQHLDLHRSWSTILLCEAPAIWFRKGPRLPKSGKLLVWYALFILAYNNERGNE